VTRCAGQLSDDTQPTMKRIELRSEQISNLKVISNRLLMRRHRRGTLLNGVRKN
jgi:hypothetical protein